MLRLVALSAFLFLSSGSVTASPLRPSPLYHDRREPAVTPAPPARVQPYHPGLAIVKREPSIPELPRIPVGPGAESIPPKFLPRYIANYDYGSGSNPPALYGSSVRRGNPAFPEPGSAAFGLDEIEKKFPPKFNSRSTRA
ncbi:hypothetical protein BC834DRAFT_873213 [Gloeopeniophorella convolvens]|nr:hypothetical protein BC834DRAFT_873213 [Gloeopeniophorella convolvens]